MPSRFRVGSPRAFLLFFATLLLVGALTALNRKAGYIDHILQGLAVLVLLAGSVLVLRRMWQQRADPALARRTADSGLFGIMPARWRAWITGESDERPRR